MLWQSFIFSTAALAAAVDRRHATSSTVAPSRTVPDPFQTDPAFYPGPTATGEAPYLAETNPAPFPSGTYTPVSPLETQVPIVGNVNNSNIFEQFGQLSPYFANPTGFGVREYALPPGANISWVNTLHRHGSRYPTSDSGVYNLGKKIANATGKVNFTGELAFLNDWNFKLGAEILVPKGRQELFDSGILHYYQYGHLYPNNGTKLVVRSTTQDRMRQSAEYFLAGFFGLTWTRNASLELIIESDAGGNWNNTLAGYDNCLNSNKGVSYGGTNTSSAWEKVYLTDAVKRFNALAPGFNFTTSDVYNAQSLCAYETVGLGFSRFCELFTYQEALGYEYSVDLSFAGNDAFQSPTGRAVGIGYQQEVMARLQHHLITQPTAQINVTLDRSNVTFPLNQSLYFDFSHDTNIMSILTAFGFTQFAQVLPTDHIVPHDLIVSHLTPFGARVNIELIDTPSPVSANRSAVPLYAKGAATRYIHFLVNQRTVPLHKSFTQCPYRDDGWCEINNFLESQKNALATSQYDFACFGNYSAVPFGTLTNGAPQGGVLTA